MSMPRRYIVDDNFFEVINTPEKAYWLGFFTADGNMFIEKKCSYRLGVTLKEADTHHLRTFARALHSNYPVKIYNSNGYKRGELYWRSKEMFDDLLRLGLRPQKSYGFDLPIIDKQLLPHYIRGIFDGDGCIYSKGKNVSASICGIPKLCTWLLNITRGELHVGGGIYERTTTTHEWTLSGRNQVHLFGDWIYKDADVYLLRKKTIFDTL